MRSDLAMAALASAAVPGMKPVSVAGLWPADPDDPVEVQRALVEDATGRRWVVHAPLDAVAGARMQRNDELVRQLARHLPFRVPAPVGYADLGRDGRAAVYPFVEGSPLDLDRLPAGQGLASAVGRTVAAIHNVARGVFEEQDVPVFDAAGCRARAIAEVDRAAETGRVPTGLLARWEEAFDAPALWRFAATPVHGSFSGSTVLVSFSDARDAATGHVVAVTDWGEARVGDPATDLASLYAQTSPQAWESVLESYALARTHRPDPYLHTRARLIAETRSLRGLATAVAEGRDDLTRRIVEVLRRMDRLTEEDDSLVPVTARARAGGADPATAGVPSPEHPDRPRTAEHDPTVEVPLPSVPGIGATVDGPGVTSAGPGDPDDAGTEGTTEDTGADEATPDTGAEDEAGRRAPAADDLDDDERLHELYGMPEADLEEPAPDPTTDGRGG